MPSSVVIKHFSKGMLGGASYRACVCADDFKNGFYKAETHFELSAIKKQTTV